MRKPLLVAAATLLAFGVTATPAYAADTLNCSDFATQQEAQATLNADKSDPNRLDGDNDGVACEALPSGPRVSSGGTTTTKSTKSTATRKSQISSVPQGGTDAGGGSTASTENIGLLTTGGALILLSGATLLVRRRLVSDS